MAAANITLQRLIFQGGGGMRIDMPVKSDTAPDSRTPGGGSSYER